MHIAIRLFATFRDRVGRQSLSVDFEPGVQPTAIDVLTRLERDYPQLNELTTGDGEIAATVTVLYNGRFVDRNTPADVVLEDGDELALSPPLTGG